MILVIRRGKKQRINITGCNYDTIAMAHQVLQRKKKIGRKKKAGKAFRCNDQYGIRPRQDRGRPYQYIMDDIGYESCDYICNEVKSKFWFDLITKMQFYQRNLTLEIYVPCREPIDHIMSIVHHFRRSFRCPSIKNKKRLNKFVIKYGAKVTRSRFC